jgi:hypothetical protein
MEGKIEVTAIAKAAITTETVELTVRVKVKVTK